MECYRSPLPVHGVMVRIGRGEYVLEGLEELCKKEGINTAMILTGIGALDICNIHTITKSDDPAGDISLHIEGPVEVGSMQGAVVNGKPHMHVVVDDVNGERVIVGHFEPGSRTSYGISINMIVLDGIETSVSYDPKTAEADFRWKVVR